MHQQFVAGTRGRHFSDERPSPASFGATLADLDRRSIRHEALVAKQPRPAARTVVQRNDFQIILRLSGWPGRGTTTAASRLPSPSRSPSLCDGDGLPGCILRRLIFHRDVPDDPSRSPRDPCQPVLGGRPGPGRRRPRTRLRLHERIAVEHQQIGRGIGLDHAGLKPRDLCKAVRLETQRQRPGRPEMPAVAAGEKLERQGRRLPIRNRLRSG